METQHEAVCTKCGKALSFVSTGSRGLWVHDDTGYHLASEPERHDANTYFRRIGANTFQRV
jgi:hypothetical protein